MRYQTFIFKLILLLLFANGLKGWSQQLSPIAPKNGLVINNDSVLLKWNRLYNAQNYELKYTNDSTFINNVTSINVGLQTSYWLVNLLSNTTYYWRVEGNNGSNMVIGQARKFTNFKPSDLTGCALWLRSDTGIVLNGTNVQSWNDLSSNSLTANQATSSSQPLWQANAINNLPSLLFDGNDMLSVSSFPYNLNVNGFLVGKKTNAIVNHGNFTSGTNFDFEMQTLKCEVALNGGTIGAFNAVEWSQLTLKRQSGNSMVILNGVQSGPVNTTVLNPIDPGAFCIGNRNPVVNSPAPLRGEISELIINTSQLGEVETTKIQNYLMDRYTPELTLGMDTTVLDNFCPINISANGGFTNYLWSTGDTGKTITVNEAGYYFVQALDIFERLQTDSIFVSYPTVQSLPSNVLCYGSQLNWNTGLTSPYTFLWQDNSIANQYLISQPGSYYVKVTDGLGCSYYSDTVNIILDNFPSIAFIGNDTSLCSGNTIQLQNGATTAINYLWSDGSMNDSLTISIGGTYWLEVSNINNCIARDTIQIVLTGIAPSANFEATNVCLGLATTFTDLTTFAPGDVISAWEWNFGDGNYGNLQNPVHLFSNNGIYTVTLKAISQTGCAGLINKQVAVLPHPVLNFLTTNNCNEKETQFNDVSNALGGTITSWIWNFNDTASTNNIGNGMSVTHQFNYSGNYQIQLIVNTIEGCVDTLLKQINIKPSPTALYSFSKLCAGDSITFKDISTIPFPQQNIFRKWTFNDTIFSTLFEPKVFYPLQGSYTVMLEIMASNGCRDTVESIVNISNYPNPNFTGNYPCLNAINLFIDSSTCANCFINSYNWTLDNQLISLNDSVYFQMNEIGTHTLNLEVSNIQGCVANKEITFMINELPLANFLSSLSFGSPPLEVSFQNLSSNAINYYLNFGDGNYSNLANPTHIFADTGVFNIALIASDINGCKSNDNELITVIPKKIDLAILSSKITSLNDYLNSEITFINLGSTIINSFDILIKGNANYNNLLEHWEGSCLPGEVKIYRLKSAFSQAKDINNTDFICYELINIDKGFDQNVNNNESCSIIDNNEFKIATVFPNPVFEKLNLKIISPNKGDYLLEIIDNKGSVVSSSLVSFNAGINSFAIETIHLQKGIYTIKINVDGKVITEVFCKL